MQKLSKIVYRWLPKSQWGGWICRDMQVVIETLELEGVRVVKVGEENYKSPSAIMFTDKPFSSDVIENLTCENSNLSGSKRPSTVVCAPHYVCITYEHGIGEL